MKLTARNILRDIRFILGGLMPSKKYKPKCYYIGYTGYGNLGDEALQQAIYGLFRGHVIFSDSRGIIVRLLERLNVLKFDCLMMGGGTLLLRSDHMLLSLADRSIEKKIIFGTGGADPEFWKFDQKKMASWISAIKDCQFIGVRGPDSIETLNKLEIWNVKSIGDPVLLFWNPIESPKAVNKRLGINFGTARVNNEALLWGGDENKFLSQMAEFIGTMKKEGWQIDIIAVSHKDSVVIKRTVRRFGLGQINVFLGYRSTFKTLTRLKSYDVFIGEKLHSVVLSYCANTPAVMIEYDPKCRDFMRSIGLQELTIRVDEFTAEDAKKMVETVYADVESYRSRAAQSCGRVKSELEKSGAEVAALIHS